MKKIMVEFIGAMLVSIFVVPACVIGLCIGGCIYGDKIEPWLKRKLGD